MIEWKTGASLYCAGPHGGRSPRRTRCWRRRPASATCGRWRACAAGSRTRATTAPRRCRNTSGYLPEHLVRRFIAKEGDAVLVTGRLPDVDSSRILPVVEKVDRALDDVRKQHPDFRISVTGLPAIAARNSARMISQLNEALPLCVAFAAVLLAIAFRSVFVGLVSLLPGLYPGGGLRRHPVGAGRRARVCLRGGAAGGVRPCHRCADPFLQPLEPGGAQGAARRPRHPQRPRAGGPGHHPDHAGAGVRPRA